MSKNKISTKTIIRLITLGAGTFIYATPYIIWTFYMPLFNAFNVDYSSFGLLMTVYGFAALPCYLLGGWIADRFNPAKLVAISLVGSGILGLIYATLPPFPVVLGIQFMLSILTVGTYWSAMLKLVKLLAKELGEGKAYSTWELFRKFINFGLAAVEVLIFTRFGEGQSGLAAALLFNSIVVIILGVFTIGAYWKENPNDEIARAKGEKVDFSLVIPLLKKPIIWIIGVIIFCVYVPSSMQGNLSAYAINVLGMTEAQGAWVVQFGQLAPLVVLPLAGILADKFGAGRATQITLIASLVSVIVMIAVPGEVAYIMPAIASILLFFAMIIMVRGVYWALIGWAGVPNLIAGTVLGVVSLIGFLPDLFIYNLAGSFLDKDPIGGYTSIFMLMGGSLLLGIILVTYMISFIRKHNPEDLFGDIHDFSVETKEAKQ